MYEQINVWSKIETRKALIDAKEKQLGTAPASHFDGQDMLAN